jgi:hypothetical protein
MKIDEDHRGIRRDPENEKYNDDDSDNDRWRDLCRMVAKEKNPTRMSTLLDELIIALDKRRQNFRQDGPADGHIGFGIDLRPGTEED